MPTIFISHASADVEIARALKLRLERAGLPAFMAPDDMHGADAWPDQLARALEGCDALVLLFSPSASASEHVAREVSIALSNGKPILAVRLTPVRPSGSLGYLLQLKQWIDVFPGPLERHFERLLAELRSMLAAALATPAGPDTGSRAGVCPNCGTQNPTQARFCSNCSALLPGALLEVQGRRVVTVLVCDLVDSRALGDRFDPEVSHRLMARYVAEARRIVVRHGGMVEKVVGDSVTAVFGLPTLHEDDALRAVRTAVEIQAAVRDLGTDLHLDPVVEIRLRIGITTGEVVTGDSVGRGISITGDAVHAAVRLAEAAAPGEILLGEGTRDLVRDAVVAEPTTAADPRGRAEPIPAFRLVSLAAGAPAHARRLDAPMVGRERELRGLRQAFEDAVSEGSCRVFTILGAAGVGKSRLVAEFLAGVAGEARTLEGRCLPYGEGITYWPVREIVHAAAGIDDADTSAAARSKIAKLVDRDRESAEIERCVARAVGLSDEAVTPEELTWGVQRFLEVLAEERPVVVVLDDIQWAEPTFLDMIEHIADWARDAPLLLVCPARPELLETRPGWGGGKLNSTSVLLAPLPTDASQRLIEGLGGGGLPAALQEQIAAAAEGNPLFIEEMVNMLRADGVLDALDRPDITDRQLERIRVPPTISALLAARLDQLVPDEKTVAERASVIGRVFERRAVAELSPERERPELRVRLLSLVRKELVRPDRSGGDEDAYRFRHLLIRDAAYEALPKSERAALHERFAHWLIGGMGDRIAEYEEVIAFHLDQAHRTRLELGGHDETTTALAAEAADWYVRAARRASAILDSQSARPLWEHAVALLDREGQAWLEATYELAVALDQLGKTQAAEARYTETLEAAAARDPALAVMARIGLLLLSRATNTAWIQEMKDLIEGSLPILEARGDERYLSNAYFVLAESIGTANQGAFEAAVSAVLHARRSGDPQTRRVAATGFVQSVVRLPPDEARRAIAEYVDPADILGAARIPFLVDMAHLEAKEGHLAKAREGLSEAIEIADRFGQPEPMVGARESAARKARWDGDFAGAEALFRRALELAEQFNLTYWAPKLQAWLAMSLFDIGQEGAAETLLAGRAGHRGEDELADLIGQLPHGRLLGRHGHPAEGLAALEAAIDGMPAMAVLLRTEARVEAIRLLREAGLDQEAADVAAKAMGDIQQSPAPLYVSMVTDALAWRPPGTVPKARLDPPGSGFVGEPSGR